MLGALRHRTAPQESRLQPVCGRNRLKPGLPLRGRSPMTNPFQTGSYSDHQDEINSYIERNRIPDELIDPLVKAE